MAAKKRKLPAAKAKPEEKPFVPVVKPTTAALRLMHQRDVALTVLGRLGDKNCTELGRRARHAVRDGYASYSGWGEAVSTSAISRPTESSATAGLRAGDEPDDWRRHDEPADPVGDAIAEVFDTMREVTRLLRIVDDQVGYVLATGAPRRVSSVASCEACTRDVLCTPEDRLVSGYCGACYRAWVRAGRPDRANFARERFARACAT